MHFNLRLNFLIGMLDDGWVYRNPTLWVIVKVLYTVVKYETVPSLVSRVYELLVSTCIYMLYMCVRGCGGVGVGVWCRV